VRKKSTVNPGAIFGVTLDAGSITFGPGVVTLDPGVVTLDPGVVTLDPGGLGGFPPRSAQLVVFGEIRWNVHSPTLEGIPPNLPALFCEL